MPNIARQLLRRDGMPRKTRKASTAPPPPSQPLPLPSLGRARLAVEVAVVVTIAVPVVVAVPFVKAIMPEAVQVGAVPVAGGLVNVQEVKVMVPV